MTRPPLHPAPVPGCLGLLVLAAGARRVGLVRVDESDGAMKFLKRLLWALFWSHALSAACWGWIKFCVAPPGYPMPPNVVLLFYGLLFTPQFYFVVEAWEKRLTR